MTELLTIETDTARARIMPALGGSLAGFDLMAAPGPLPVFRRWPGETENPRTFSFIPTVPFFGRISGGGITWDGKFYPIERNDPEDTHPLHGDGWRSPWEVAEATPDHVLLRLRSKAIPPFDYLAQLGYRLAGSTLEIRLSVRNCAESPVPYGLGLHPWFPRTPDVRLTMRATGTWLEQPPQLPTDAEPRPLPPEWDFSGGRSLPPEFIDNSFAGWDGRARIEWPREGYAVSVEADPAIRLSHLYAPGPEVPIFCFEQITHVSDAFNIPAPPEKTGLRVLAPGEETSMLARFDAERTE